MTKMTWSAIIVLLISAVLISLQLQKNPVARSLSGTQTRAGEPQDSSLLPSNNQNANGSDTKINEVADNPENKIEDPVFHRWLRDEAKNIDAPSLDEGQKRDEIRTVVRRMTRAQSRQLLATAKNPKAPASEKILSTFLLVEGGAVSRGELTDLIASPLVEQGPHEPHTEAEFVGVREKTLRIMAIDGLFSRAQREPEARQALVKVISDIQDPYIKAYAQEKLDRLSR